MGSYIEYFAKPHMIVVCLGVLAVAMFFAWRCKKYGSSFGWIWCFLTVLSVGGILAVTVFREAPLGFELYSLADWHIDTLFDGRMDTDTMLNLVLFIPAGLFLTLWWPHPFRVMGLLATLSIIVECIQGATGIGSNEVDDLLMNCLGGFIGIWIGRVVVLIVESIRSKTFKVVMALRIAVVGAVIAGGCWFGCDQLAVNRQAWIAAEMDALYAGTTLTRHGDDAAYLNAYQVRNITTDAVYHGDDLPIMVDRIPAKYYFSQRCVYAVWMPEGFATLLGNGADCEGTLWDPVNGLRKLPGA